MASGGSEGNSCKAPCSGPPWLPFPSLMLPALQTYTASPWWPWDRYMHKAWLSSDASLAEQETFKNFQSHRVSAPGFHTGAATSLVSMMSFPLSFAWLAEVTSSLGKYHSGMNRASDPKTRLMWLASCWVGSWSPPWTVSSPLSAWDSERSSPQCVFDVYTLVSIPTPSRPPPPYVGVLWLLMFLMPLSPHHLLSWGIWLWHITVGSCLRLALFPRWNQA